MQAILTDSGSLIGWFRDPHVVDPQGLDMAFVQAWGLFSYDGQLRGYFEDGLFRNKRGIIIGRLGKSASEAPQVDWTRARAKEPVEHPLIISFSRETAEDGWNEVFAPSEPALAR